MGLTAIVKPTHDCNLACKYCYIDEKAENGRMAPELIRMLRNESDPMRRFARIEALAYLDIREAIPELAEMLNSNDKYMQIAALEALSRLNAYEIIPEIQKILRSGDVKMQDAECKPMYRVSCIMHHVS